MARQILPGQTYRHFKGGLYIVLDIVNDSNTNRDDEIQKIVIYQALYGERAKWARNLDEFASEVDHVKYPDVKQKYRFEEIEVGVKDGQ